MTAIILAVAYILLFRGSTPKPWTPPGYGKRRQTEWMREWRAKWKS